MAKGVLIAAMDFSNVDAGEFNDWYDTEHVPERQRVPGFLMLQRWIGAENPKQSVATYDLETVGVLQSPGYRAIGGENLSLAAILGMVASLSGKKPPRVRLPIAAVVPVATVAEGLARLTGKEPFVTLDGLRMARKKMFFTSAKAEAELGYRWRPAAQGLADAVAWFRQAGMCP